MKNLLKMTLILLLSTSAYAKKTTTPRVLKLSTSNTVVFRGAVDNETVNKAKFQLMEISKKLDAKDTIYLVLDTPGGSIFAGLSLLDFIGGLSQEVSTITIRAASMGFIIAQSLNKRYILPSGVFMMHRASVGIRGQINEGEFETRASYVKNVVADIERQMALRVGISLKKYKTLVKDEVYSAGYSSVSNNFADEIVLISCGSLQGVHEEITKTLFGRAQIIWSNCPLIRQPMRVQFESTSPFFKLPPLKQQFIKDSILKNYTTKEDSNITWIGQ